MTAPDDDPRWQRLTDPNHTCPCCGRRFDRVFDLVIAHPGPWPHGPRPEGEAELLVGDDRLAEDVCEFDLHRFVRAPLAMPIAGTDRMFRLHAWGSIAFDRYMAFTLARSGEGPPLAGCTGWLVNALPGFFRTELLPVSLRVGPEAGAVSFHAHYGPIAAAQENGIDLEMLLDIFAAAGDDLRPHLEAD